MPPAASAHERLLRAWEGTLDEQPLRRGASLLAGYRCDDVEEVAEWSIPARDAALYDLRRDLFGHEALAIATCPRCGQQLELPLDLRGLRPPGDGIAVETVGSGGYVVTLRLPTTADLANIADSADEELALAALVTRCVISVLDPDGKSCTLQETPAGLDAMLRLRLAELLDDVDVQLEVTCPGCELAFAAPFDIAPFLLRELDAWAGRLLRDIHQIACAYGWDEATILALSPRRRRAYLDLIEVSR
jgi:hypothetical protein